MGKVAPLLPCSLFKSPPKSCHFLPVVDQLLDDDGLDHLEDDDDDDDGDNGCHEEKNLMQRSLAGKPMCFAVVRIWVATQILPHWK